MIDWARVNELKDEVGTDGFEEVVELFLEEVEEVIAKLDGGDHGQLEQDLHFLKGSALNLGFQQFSQLCLEGELLSHEGKQDTVNVSAITSNYAASKEHFLADLGSNT